MNKLHNYGEMTRDLKRIFVALLGAAGLFCCVGDSTAWAVDQLKVSSNGRYLVKDDGSDTPFFWLGSTGWAAIVHLDRQGIDAYLDNRINKKINVIQSVAHFHPHGYTPQREFHLHNPKNFYEHRPFAGGANSPDTSQPLVIAGGSPTNPNDYWDHMDYFVNAVEERDIYLALLPVWGCAFINSRAVCTGSLIEYNQTTAKSFGEFLGDRYKNKKHIIWVLGGDTGPTENLDQRLVYRAMAEGIVKGVTGQTVAWNQSHPAWNSVLMTYHPAGLPQSSSQWFHTDSWLDFNGIESHSSQDKVYSFVNNDYNLAPVKPTMNLEPNYEGTPDAGTLGTRRQAYHSFLAGGAGHTYGATTLNGDGPVWGFGPGWENGLDQPGLTDLGHLYDFFTARPWWTFTPNQATLASGASSGVTLKAAVTSSASDRIVVYFARNNSASIHLDRITTASRATGTWFDPRNGNTQPAGTHSTSSTISFTPPSGWEDALLELVGSAVVEHP